MNSRKITFERFRRRCGCCRVCASVFLSVLLIASVLCVVVLGWFSLRLKRDLDFVRKRLSKGECGGEEFLVSLFGIKFQWLDFESVHSMNLRFHCFLIEEICYTGCPDC